MADAIPLADVCHLFGLSRRRANEMASTQQLPIPAFKLGSQKSPWVVSSKRLDEYVARKAKEAESDHKAINAG